MKVRATERGFYGGHRRRPGQVFNVSRADFSNLWMEKIAAEAQAPTTSVVGNVVPNIGVSGHGVPVDGATGLEAAAETTAASRPISKPVPKAGAKAKPRAKPKLTATTKAKAQAKSKASTKPRPAIPASIPAPGPVRSPAGMDGQD